jgi:hypothetical protein
VKKVRVIAAAAPAALGLLVPAAAYARTTTPLNLGTTFHRVRPDTAKECLSARLLSPNSDDCLGVRGTANWVSAVDLTQWSDAGTGYIGYADVPGHAGVSKWRAGTLTGYPGEYSHGYWYPNCSFPTGAHVYGWTNYWPYRNDLVARIAGSTFTGKHACAPV